MSREEIIAAIQRCAHKLGRPPTRAELKKMAGIAPSRVKLMFRGMTAALREAGLDPKGPGHLIPTDDLLLDWARVARKLGKLPAMSRYQLLGRCTHVPFIRRYGTWRAVPGAFQRLAREKQIEEEWKDVLAMIDAANAAELRKNAALPDRARAASADRDGLAGTEPSQAAGAGAAAATGAGIASAAETWQPRAHEYSRRKLLGDRGLAGPPAELEGLAHEPANEQGVVFFFGTLAHRLGFRVLTFQQGFPDCEAMREVRPGKWQRVRIEFEYESRNYLKHGHERDGCDVIVCWRHNWPECPKNLEVVELRRLVRKG